MQHVNSTQNSWAQRMRARLDGRTKPVGSLGRLESLAEKVAGITQQELPGPLKKLVVVAAADHGVARHSLYPKAVTSQMVANIYTGGAAVSVLARQAGADVWLVDAGIDWAAGPFASLDAVLALPRDPKLTRSVNASLGAGTHDWSTGSPAMSVEQFRKGVATGRELFRQARAEGYDCIAFGDMGIGNTTAAAALVMALGMGSDSIDRGTGISEEQLSEKRRVILHALEEFGPFVEVEQAMCSVGGFELLIIAGMMSAVVDHPCVCLLDGFPVTAAALAAVRLNLKVGEYLIAGHCSKVSGHRPLLDELGLDPILDLNMRLGEGSGAVLAMSILDAALSIPRDMAGFADAGVDTAAAEEERY